MNNYILGSFVTLLGTLVAQQSLAGDCSFLNRDPLTLRDTELFYQSPQSKRWESLDEKSSDATWSDQKVAFAYVIREKFDQSRSGLVVVKSGRARIGTDTAPRVVELVRERPDSNDDNTAFDNASCGSIPEFSRGTVSAAFYDRYHDLGSNVPAQAQALLDRFHYKYVGRHGRCRRSNDNRRDSMVPLVRRSNLGQFSFDPSIVGTATNSQILELTRPDEAYAGGSDKLAQQRVEIKAYRVRKGFPTCVVFTLRVPPSTGFVRINDLEGLARYNLDYIRSDERSWSLDR